LGFGTSGGKRQREATRDRKKKDKEERLARNRAMRAQGIDPSGGDEAPSALPEVKLEDIIISGVAPRGPKGSNGPRKMFVGGLSWETTSQELNEAFAKFGPVAEAIVMLDRNTGRSRGFGFVTFEDPLNAAAAMKELDGSQLDGRTIRVNPADG
jgi:RNA recognition motif-containing protein